MELNKEQLFLSMAEIAKNNELKESEVDEILKEAIVKSFHSKFDPDAELEVLIDKKNLDFKLINKSKLIVEEKDIEDEIRTVEINIDDAKKINKDAKIGDMISEEVSFEVYSRSIAQQVKQLLIQKIKEARKSIVYSKHKGLVGEMVDVKVIASTPTFAIFNLLDGTPAFMPGKFKNPNIELKIGAITQVYVEEVLEESKDAQIIVSNGSPIMVRRILENEVPEIMEGTVEIVAMSRIVGERTKIAVKSDNESVDPVGAIIGAGGERITRIVEKLFGEKIDVIRWNENQDKFIAEAMSPAKVVAVLNKNGEDDGKKIVVVPNRHHTLAIGKRGVNARLVAELAKVRVDIMSIDQAKEAGIEYELNGNLTEEEIALIESGQKFIKKPRTDKQTFNRNINNINIDDISTEIEDFNETSNEETFVPIEKEEPIFSDAELKAMESQFEIDDELADFANIDMLNFGNDEEEK